MATEKTLQPKKLWQKLLIYWHTKDFSTKVYDIALVMAVAIFTNRKIYEEELHEARSMLQGILHNESGPDLVMEYIELKLLQYSEDDRLWQQERDIVREMIKKEEELYTFLINIFEADKKLDKEEKELKDSIKTLLALP